MSINKNLFDLEKCPFMRQNEKMLYDGQKVNNRFFQWGNEKK